MLRLTALGLGCLMLQACASTSSVSSRFQADTAVAAASMMIAARTPEQALRKRYELACHQAWAGKAASQPSHQVIANWYEAGYQQLLEAMDTEAVLVIDITPVLIAPMQMPPANEISDARFGADAGPTYNTWQIGGNKEPSAAGPDKIIEVEARLIGADGQVRWEGLVRTHEANDLQAIARSQCQALGEYLRKMDLLR